MKVMTHQTPGVELPIGLDAGFAQRLEKQLPIFMVAKDLFLLVTAVMTS
jgi:hypothetical protein